MEELSEFDIQVIMDCYKATGSKEWNHEVYSWFYRNDFIPACWRSDYIRVVSKL